MKQLSLCWTKITMNCIMQLIVLAIAITCTYFAAISFMTYGWEYVINPEYVLPQFDDSIRMLMIFFNVILLFQSSYNIHFCIKMWKLDQKLELFSFGILTWLLLPYFIYKGCVDKHFQTYTQHISQDRQEGLQISNLHVFNCIKYGLYKDKLFRNTILAYFTFLSTLIGFIFIWIPKYSSGLYFLSFEVLTYFTQLTNMSCFIFMCLFLIFHKKMVFRDNVILTYLAAYIFIVGFVFWAALLPFYQNIGDFTKNPLRVISSVWLHTCTPIIFVSFAISSFLTNYRMPKQDIKLYCFNGCIYPAFYSIYAYLLPFTVHDSVYGLLTNLNAQMMNAKGQYEGYWWIIFIALFAVVLFISIIILFWYINKKVVINHQSKARVLAEKQAYNKLSKE